MTVRPRRLAVPHLLGLVLSLLLILPGCVSEDSLQTAENQQGEQEPNKQPVKGNEQQPPAIPKQEPADAKAPPPLSAADAAKRWDELLQRASDQVQAGDLRSVHAVLAELEKLTVPPTDEQTERLAQLHLAAGELLQARLSKRRAEETAASQAQSRAADASPPDAEHLTTQLAEARSLVERGDLEQAGETLQAILQASPPAQLRESSEQLQQAIERRQQTMKRLESAMQALASQDRTVVRRAQEQLFEDVDNAVPLLVQAARHRNPIIVGNALESLRLLRRPQVALPALLEVLSDEDQAESWASALQQIEQLGSPGAGEELLQLALTGDHPEQRRLALQGLARVVDPPERTLVALLPMLLEDRAELTLALEAAAHAVRVHHQSDLRSRLGLGDGSEEVQWQQLDALPGRLRQIIGQASEAAPAARALAIATRQIEADPLPGVEVLAYTAQLPPSNAAAVLDGVWDSTEPKHGWRHPVGRKGSIVLDLGSERTVVGVRIWNLNESGGMHRGWKEVAIYVGSVPTAHAEPVATGTVPQAPGTAKAIDYSTTLPVDFVRGRYLRLESRSVWREDGHGGLSEVQVLGY